MIFNSLKSNFIYNDNTNRISAIIKTANDLERLNKHFAKILTYEEKHRTALSYHSSENESKDTAHFINTQSCPYIECNQEDFMLR